MVNAIVFQIAFHPIDFYTDERTDAKRLRKESDDLRARLEVMERQAADMKNQLQEKEVRMETIHSKNQPLTTIDTIVPHSDTKLWSIKSGDLVEIKKIEGRCSHYLLLAALVKAIADVVWFVTNNSREKHLLNYIPKELWERIASEEEYNALLETAITRKRHNKTELINQKLLLNLLPQNNRRCVDWSSTTEEEKMREVLYDTTNGE